MLTWYRHYPGGSSGSVIETPDGFVGIYEPGAADEGLVVRFAPTRELAQAAVDAIAGVPWAPSEWHDEATQDDTST